MCYGHKTLLQGCFTSKYLTVLCIVSFNVWGWEQAIKYMFLIKKSPFVNNKIMSQHNCLFILPCLFFLLDSLFFSQQDYQLYLFDKALLELLKVIKKSTNGLKNLCLQLFNIFSPIFCAAKTCQTNRPPWWNCQLFGEGRLKC